MSCEFCERLAEENIECCIAGEDFVEPNFCPACGTPLTEPKALTVEELHEMNEPLKHWIWIEDIKNPYDSGYMRTCMDWSNGECFCCGWPGVMYSLKYADYGKTWAAYDRKPKEDNADG